MRTEFNNIDKVLESRGNLSEKARLADLEKDVFDIELSIMESLKEDFKKEAKPGTSFLDCLNPKTMITLNALSYRPVVLLVKLRLKNQNL